MQSLTKLHGNYYEHGNVYVILKFTIMYFIVLMYVRYGVQFSEVCKILISAVLCKNIDVYKFTIVCVKH